MPQCMAEGTLRMQKYLLLITDVIIIVVSFIFALLLRFHGIVDVVHNQNFTIGFLLILIPVLFYFYDLYKPEYYTQRLRFFYRFIKAWLLSALIYIVIGFTTKFTFLIESRAFIVSFFLLSLGFFFGIRVILMKILLECCYRLPYGNGRCEYVGPHEYYDGFKRFFNDNKVSGIKLCNSDETTSNGNTTFLYCTADTYDKLYIAIKQYINGGKRLYVASPLFTHLGLGWEWCTVNNVPVYSFDPRSNHRIRDFLRRCMDIIVSIIGLIILAPLFFLVSLAIKLDSPGSIIYKQERCGKNGKKFIFYKFRSMRGHDKSDMELANESNHYMKKVVPKTQMVENDYITDIGRIIRKTSIDEWPQFINVLRGDMSLIGPRPHRPHEVKCYQDWHKDRLLVKQGLTGLWQIYGRGEMPCDKSIFLDLIYVSTRSLSLDIKLLFQTIPAVILGRGAY
jgi:exopolysaccharide biosynthesis polyprenyl glycosylphosphotransferase